MNISRYSLAILSVLASSAYAADDKVTVGVGVTDFSDGFGDRKILSAESVSIFGANTVVVGASGGRREYGDGSSFNGTALSGTFYRDWSDLISTRTSVTFSSDDPVFVNRVIDQDFTFKVWPRATLTAGARHSEYFGGSHALAWSAGASYYFPRLMVKYRYTHHELSGIGDGYGNMLMFRLKDSAGDGFTQLWLGQGTSIQEYDWAPVVQEGDHKSATLQRSQPLTKNLMLNVSIGKSWNKTPVASYQGVTANVGVSYRW